MKNNITLQEFINEINSQIKGDKILNDDEYYQLGRTYSAMIRNEFQEDLLFDMDDYGRIIYNEVLDEISN